MKKNRNNIKEILLRKLNKQMGNPIPTQLIDRFIKKDGHGHHEEDAFDNEPVQRKRMVEAVLPYPKNIEQSLTEQDVTGTVMAILCYPENRDVFPEVKALLVDILDSKTVRVETALSEPLTLEFHEISKQYKAVIEVLAATNNRFIFSGHLNTEGKFCVNDIHVHKSGRMRPYEVDRVVHERQLQWCMGCIAGQQNGSPNYVDNAQKVTFKTPPEFRLLLLCAGQCFPKSIQSWATTTLDTLEEGGIGDDTRKHMVTALSYMLNVDWSDRPLRVPEPVAFRKALDENIWGLDNVKDALVEAVVYMAHTGRKTPDRGLLLVGPPGVCKTAITKAFGQLVGLPCAEVDYSSTCDVNVLIGSPRLYANGQPGAIAQAMLENRSKRLLLLVNELDKVSVSKNSENVVTDPSRPLLNILCHDDFHDEFVECPIPTDGIYCVATANSIESISPPILSRFRVIELTPYSLEEKRKIFTECVLPRALRRADLSEDAIRLTDRAVDLLMEEYAVEPGARDLEEYAERLIQRHLCEIRTAGDNRQRTLFATDDITTNFGAGKLHVPVVEHAGEAIGLYQRDSSAILFKIQAEAVSGGAGRFNTINIGADQYGFCKAAYLAVKDFVDIDLESYDITLYLDQILPETTSNYIGMAASVAILSSVRESVLATTNEVFFGAVDLFGNVQGGGLNPLIAVKRTVGRGYVLYGAKGSHTSVQGCHHDGIFEVDTIQELFSWLESKNNKRRT